MTGMLASVNSLEEAGLVLAQNVDIIDLKEPALGALGGLKIGLVKKIVTAINGQCPISATIGDLPMQPELVFNSVQAMAETGVNYVKIGFFPDGNVVQVIEKLAQLSLQTKLIAVLFADTKPSFSLINHLKDAGFTGIMLDTLDKSKGSLMSVMAINDIEDFVRQVKSKHLICGLAGSLKRTDIPLLMPYHPDYLGFRGALCDQQERTSCLNKQAVLKIKQAMIEFPP
jgi:uncharacterized protein (UPF0264 family)